MSILAEIIEHKQTEIAALDAGSLRRAAEASAAPRDFLAALTPLPFALSGATNDRRGTQTKRGEEPGVRAGVSLIAELKRASFNSALLRWHSTIKLTSIVYVHPV